MNKELEQLVEVMRDNFLHMPVVRRSISAVEDKPDARVSDVLMHMMRNEAPYGATATVLVRAAQRKLVTMWELIDVTASMQMAYPGTAYPLSQYGNTRNILRQYTSDEDVRLLIEHSVWLLPSLSVYGVYASNFALRLNARRYRVTLVTKDLSLEAILEVMMRGGKRHENIGKTLCYDEGIEEAQDYDVYTEATSDGLSLNIPPHVLTATLKHYRPLTREEFEAIRLAIQITH